jgi:hypothetical protein
MDDTGDSAYTAAEMRIGLFFTSLYVITLATAAVGAEIRVSLFDQPCQMSGPVDQASLKAIHSISPAQLPLVENRARAQESLDKVRAAKDVPAWLDPYRKNLMKRLEAQLAYYDALAAAKKSGKAGPLLEAVKKHLPEKRYPEFEAAATKLEATKFAEPGAQRLTDSYNELIQPDPEEEFHRAIGRAKVKYACTFEDSSGNDDGEE